ncbi:hypothetical protein AKJ09_08521 [Labilithrix luteola]|uniref:Tetratricopeptide repeat protein n=2 Tax=Labilithrix luteola TaxID=1391654 RepID=A0A0K1Q7Z2_9BACT|nr:hypothetical protein AKJ09_08521 [Labilithrix luteola]
MGTQAFQAKRYSEAALHFEAAAGFRTNAVALYTAGLAWDLASRPERAADAFGRALEVGGLDPKQTGLAKERVGQLERTLGTLSVTAPEGWKVQLDTFSEMATPVRLHGSPGVHALTVRAPGKAIERRDVSLDAGKVTPLELKDEPKEAPKEPEPVAAAPPEAPAPPAHAEFWNTRRVVGGIVGGAGVAVLASSIVLGLQANSAKDAYDAGPTRASFDHASSLQTWTNVAIISGAVLLAGGVALVVWPDKESGHAHVSVSGGPGFGVVGGSF